MSIINLLHCLHLSEPSAGKMHIFKSCSNSWMLTGGITFANQYTCRLSMAVGMLRNNLLHIVQVPWTPWELHFRLIRVLPASIARLLSNLLSPGEGVYTRESSKVLQEPMPVISTTSARGKILLCFWMKETMNASRQSLDYVQKFYRIMAYMTNLCRVK